MPVTSWRKPSTVEAYGDGSTSSWNQFDGGIAGDELSDSPAGFSELYWFSSSSSTQFSSTAYAHGFNFSADSIGANDKISGIEIETVMQSSNGSRKVGLRTLAVTLTGSLEDGRNAADRVLDGAEVTDTYGGSTDLLGAALTKAAVEAAGFGVFWRTESDTTTGRRARMKSLRARIHYITDGLLTQLSLTGVETGSDVVIIDETVTANGDGSNVLQTYSNVTDSTVSYTYSNPPSSVGVAVYKAGKKPFYVRGLSLDSNGASIPVSQVDDPAYEA